MISIGEHLTVLQSVDSTNNYAMAKVRAGLANHGDAFFALEQINGKGQWGKTWQTEPGNNIILTVILHPQYLQVEKQFELSVAIALACYDFFFGYAGNETKIKWPNDIYWRDRKAGGILIENIISGQLTNDSNQFSDNISRLSANNQFNKWQWAIIGIGININQTIFPDSLFNPVSLKQITGKDRNVIDMAKKLCTHLQERYDQLLQNNDLLKEYNQYLYKQNQIVQLKKDKRLFNATINKVTATGQLVVTTTIEERFTFGEVEWILI